MEIQLLRADWQSTNADLHVVGLFAESLGDSKIVAQMDRALRGALRRAAREEDFSAKEKQTIVLDTLGQLRCRRVALVGLGRHSSDVPSAMLALGATATRMANRVGAKKVVLHVPSLEEEGLGLQTLARGLVLGGYRFDQYLTDSGRKPSLRACAISWRGRKTRPAPARAAIRRGAAIARAVELARDWVNQPPHQLYPEVFAKEIVRMARAVGLKARVFDPPKLERMKMALLLAVGRGSVQGPRLVHLQYVPPGRQRRGRPVVLVGKGITFDSGGLSLKSTANMVDMKGDMGGAAAVVGAMRAIAEIEPPVPVEGVVALAENMPSGSALKIGDVIRGAAGKTVEVVNTDAEGRLVLADALHFASTLRPRQIIDLATLTGACVVALGTHTGGVFSPDAKLAEQLVEAGARSGEPLWQLPMDRQLREQLKSPVADLRNMGERWGGAITAALFLEEFVDGKPWAHLDIAGPGMASKQRGHLSKGGTGVGVATLVELLT